MLRSYDGLDDRGQVVDVGESLDAEDDIVEGGARGRGCLFGGSDDWRRAVWSASYYPIGLRKVSSGRAAPAAAGGGEGEESYHVAA